METMHEWFNDPWTFAAQRIGEMAAVVAMGLPNSTNLDVDEIGERIRQTFIEASNECIRRRPGMALAGVTESEMPF